MSSDFGRDSEKLPFFRHEALSLEKTYELHDMEGQPVIFHRDEVRLGCFCPTNWHENLEILYFTEGTGRLVCGDVCTAVSEGDFAVIDSGLLHRVESDDTVGYYCLIIDSNFCRLNGFDPESARFPRVIRSEALFQEYNKVAQAFLADDAYRTPILRSAVIQFTVFLLRNFRLPGENTPEISSPGIRRTIGYIRAHFEETLDVDTLASVAGLSKYHFLREFKRLTGQTAVTYINTVRVEEATRLLMEGKMSVSAIASACGFSGHSYFSKVYSRFKGILPSEVQARATLSDK